MNGWIDNPGKKYFSQNLFFELCVCRNCGWIGWMVYSHQNFLTKLNFQKMYVVNSGWIGWFAKFRFSQTPIFKMCVLQTLLKWLTCHFVLPIFSGGSILNIHVASSGWMVELPILAKIISRETDFSNYMCGATVVEWLNWQSWQKIFLAKLIFRIMCVLHLVVEWLNCHFSQK